MFIRSGNYVINLAELLYAEDEDFTDPGHGVMLYFSGTSAGLPVTLDELWEMIQEEQKTATIEGEHDGQE
jgi:hypothetical protein